MKNRLLTVFFLLLAGCSSQQLSDYDNTQPKFDVASFFNGSLTAHGVVSDRSGKVTRRFSVEMLGSWEGEQGKLEEWFEFDDGEKTTRTWLISKNSDGTYSGSAGDIIGTAQGQSNGFALHWDYQLMIKVDDTNYQVTFDDWLYQINDNLVINKSKIKKWGFDVGEVLLVIQKTN